MALQVSRSGAGAKFLLSGKTDLGERSESDGKNSGLGKNQVGQIRLCLNSDDILMSDILFFKVEQIEQT